MAALYRQQLDDEAARLCELLTRRPFTGSVDAVGEVLLSWHASFNHEEVVRQDISTGASLLLLLATRARDSGALLPLFVAAANALPTEDAFAALVDAFASSSTQVDDIDQLLHRALSSIKRDRVNLPRASAPSRATVICTERRWTRSLHAMMDVDPWAMHYLQSLPSSIAAGVKATADATALVAAVAAGDEAATRQAVVQLFDLMQRDSEWNIDPFLRAAARAAVRAFLQVHEAAGTLRALATHADANDLNWVAMTTGDVDAVLALAAAGALSDDVGALYELVDSRRWGSRDASGAPVFDERLAGCYQQLYDVGMRIPQREEPEVSVATMSCAQYGRLQCLRLMVEVIDPHARAADDMLHTALHAAAQGCHADCIVYLIQAGWDVHARDEDGMTPMDLCITSAVDRHACVAAITALTAGMDDVRPLLLRSSALVTQPAAGSLFNLLTPLALRFATSSRVLLHLVAAVRATPAPPSMNDYELKVPRMFLFRSESLDAHSEHGVYIPDQLRAGGDAAAAVQFAVQLDVLVDLLPELRYDSGRKMRGRPVTAVMVWQQYAQTGTVPLAGMSTTLMTWAYMRRLHALLRRRAVLRMDLKGYV